MSDIDKIDILNRALVIANNAHKGQVDKGGEEYINHPIRVSDKCENIDQKIVAILHDVIEDSDITENYLINQGFPIEIINAVSSLSKRKGEKYEDFIQRVKRNKIGKSVKIYDLEDNMDIRRLSCISEKDVVRLNKYLKAYRELKKEE